MRSEFQNPKSEKATASEVTRDRTGLPHLRNCSSIIKEGL